MKRKTIYIAGPIRGLPDNNSSAFNEANDKLRTEGWHAIDPFDFTAALGGVNDVQSNPRLLRAVMDAELAAIPHLDTIYLLRGWERSEGARAELKVAIENGKQILLEGAEE